MWIFSVNRNTVTEISEELLNDTFAEFDGGNPVKNITDR